VLFYEGIENPTDQDQRWARLIVEERKRANEERDRRIEAEAEVEKVSHDSIHFVNPQFKRVREKFKWVESFQ